MKLYGVNSNTTAGKGKIKNARFYMKYQAVVTIVGLLLVYKFAIL